MSEMPCLFDQRGVFVGLSKDQIEALSDDQRRAYGAVYNAADACQTAEKQLADAERELRATVIELRDIEGRLANLPKPSFMTIWREMAGQRL